MQLHVFRHRCSTFDLCGFFFIWKGVLVTMKHSQPGCLYEKTCREVSEHAAVAQACGRSSCVWLHYGALLTAPGPLVQQGRTRVTADHKWYHQKALMLISMATYIFVNDSQNLHFLWVRNSPLEPRYPYRKASSSTNGSIWLAARHATVRKTWAQGSWSSSGWRGGRLASAASAGAPPSSHGVSPQWKLWDTEGKGLVTGSNGSPECRGRWDWPVILAPCLGGVRALWAYALGRGLVAERKPRLRCMGYPAAKTQYIIESLSQRCSYQLQRGR